ncbi:hypothetical protein Tco_1313714 [Tanacetum coccineum]
MHFSYCDFHLFFDEEVGSPPLSLFFLVIFLLLSSASVVASETSTITPVISSAAPMVETTLDQVASRPSSLSEFPIAPVTAPSRDLTDGQRFHNRPRRLFLLSPYLRIPSNGPPLPIIFYFILWIPLPFILRVDAPIGSSGSLTRDGPPPRLFTSEESTMTVLEECDRPGARECTYQDFMKCQPLSFKGTEGVVGLIRCSEKMETVFHISNCPENISEYCYLHLLDSGINLWNSHKRPSNEAAYAYHKSYERMTEVYCPKTRSKDETDFEEFNGEEQ